MIIGLFADPHITKNMRNLQEIWDVSAMSSIYHMYDKFDELNVECVVCLGDFFDAPRIEARSMNLVLPILDTINSRSYPTYILLGNHEADSRESNILDFLSSYDNIIPITHTADIEGMLFIPYYEDPSSVEIQNHHIVFTHHDIYGSELASGKTKAFFGVDTSVFNAARLVMNGHVHLKSRVSHNIVNAGSLLVSSQGELRVGDYPSYYLLDTSTCHLQSFDNEYSMIYQSIDLDEVSKILDYDASKLVLRVDYEDEIPETFTNNLQVSWRKKIVDIESEDDVRVSTSNFDMKNYIISYIKNDQDIPEDFREDYIKLGLELL